MPGRKRRGAAIQRRSGRGLRRTSLYLDGRDRACLARLIGALGLQSSEVLRVALRRMAFEYGLLTIKPIPTTREGRSGHGQATRAR